MLTGMGLGFINIVLIFFIPIIQKFYNWIKKYSEWIDYRHKVTILDNGTFVVLPPNLETKKS